MANETPASFAEVLADEYRALRPDSAPGTSPDGSPPRLEDLYARAHADPEPLSALCISGGGIRSATFALGAIQGLAEHRLMWQFDYLSTVSGGGYVGGWLTAWTHRAGGFDQVAPRLREDAPEPAPGEPDPIRHLREYNSYLSPRRGSFSADVWTLVATVLRNILLNWLVLVPILLLALLPPRLYVSLLSFPEILHADAIFGGATPHLPNYAAPELDQVSGSLWVQWVLPIASVFFFALAWYNILRFLPGVGNRSHDRAAYQKWVLAPLIGAVLTYLLWDSLYFLGSHFRDETQLGWQVEWTLVPVAAAWLAFLATRGGSLRSRLRLLFGPLSLAILSMAAGIGVALWGTTNFLIWSPNPETQVSWDFYVTFGPSLVLLGFYLGTALFLGLSSSFLKDEDREWMSRAMAGVLLSCVAWTGLCFLVLMAPGWIFGWHPWQNGLLGMLGGASAWISSRGGRQGGGPGDTAPAPSLLGRLSSLALKVAPVIFLAVLAVGLSVATNRLIAALQGLFSRWYRTVGTPPPGLTGEPMDWEQHYSVLTHSQPVALLALVALLLALAWLTARYININIFSLHGMYRDRLIRAYLGASNPNRQASAFTGFAAGDNLPMASLDPRRKPFHVLNLTLNLVGSSRLDWQQRKAQPFTVSPLACGNADLGYRPSAGYTGGDTGISLGTAIAISGAAASPNMGSFSSPAVGFIMTLFNARLGAWLGNPGPAGAKTWRHAGPRAALRSLFKEALGLTTNESEYVYLSDGGHFENFGLYEMVRRRCRTIVVLDGGADPHLRYDDLANALRKIRIDLRIPIDFDDDAALEARDRRVRCATAVIRYSAVDGPVPDGRLLYFKPLLRGNEPPDVASYGRSHPDFPHQSTANQWFDEAQTESYRKLGLHTVHETARGWKGGTLEEFARHVESSNLGVELSAAPAAP